MYKFNIRSGKYNRSGEGGKWEKNNN